jgi:hypothetical protein
MEYKKRVTILAIVALVLAITAITLNSIDSDSPAPTTGNAIRESSGAGEVGLVIIPQEVEDKLEEAQE